MYTYAQLPTYAPSSAPPVPLMFPFVSMANLEAWVIGTPNAFSAVGDRAGAQPSKDDKDPPELEPEPPEEVPDTSNPETSPPSPQEIQG